MSLYDVILGRAGMSEIDDTELLKTLAKFDWEDVRGSSDLWIIFPAEIGIPSDDCIKRQKDTIQFTIDSTVDLGLPDSDVPFTEEFIVNDSLLMARSGLLLPEEGAKLFRAAWLSESVFPITYCKLHAEFKFSEGRG